MPKFKVAVDHSLDRDAALSKLQGFSDRIKEQAPVAVTDVKEDWDDQGNLVFGFTAMGFTISGQMVTTGSDVKVTGEMPFAALPFRGMIEKEVESKIREAIA